MGTFFLDSSAAVKCYVDEMGTNWLRSLTSSNSAHRFFIARITGVEVISALTRRNRGGSLTSSDYEAAVKQFRRDIANLFTPLEISEELLSVAMSLAEKYALRAYDAVQLAAVLGVANNRIVRGLEPPRLLSSDIALNDAALTEGLVVNDLSSYEVDAGQE